MEKPVKNTPKEDSPALRMVKTSYKEMYEGAKNAGRLERPTYRIHTWSEDSALLIGRVEGIDDFRGGRFEAEVKCYRIATDEGMVSCILGTYTDTQLSQVDLLNHVVCIKFCGQKPLEDGRKVNVFDVDIVGYGGGQAHADE